MTLVSVSFLVFVLATLFVYYIIPNCFKWVILLIASAIFYCLTAAPFTAIYLILVTVFAFAAGLICSNNRSKFKGSIVLLAVFLIAGIWFVAKGSAYYLWLVQGFADIQAFHYSLFASALGMGFYTMQAIGYIIDCWRGDVEPQRNFFKLLLFVGFFPQLTTGPISRYKELMPQLLSGFAFDSSNIARGSQRILWGLFKKLVIAEQLAFIVNGAYSFAGPDMGCWAWVGMLLYPLQLYADFSGCIDISLGAAELFGIRLPENFDNPFFSRTNSEFWRRWHMTLGSWARDYVLYPLMKSRIVLKFGKRIRRRFGKRVGKLISLAVCTFATWFVMGFWHGAFKYVIGVGLWYWLLQMIAEILSPQSTWIKQKLKINEARFSWHLFQSLRTYGFFSIGLVFFRSSGISQALVVLKSAAASIAGIGTGAWIFFDGSVISLAQSSADLNVVIIGLVAIVFVAILREKYGYARNWVAMQGLPFRWFVWISLIALTSIYGVYGPSYDASAFIYGQF